TGDVDGDSIADVLVGADQEDGPGEPHRGGVWLLRGGAHLASGLTTTLLGFGTAPHPLDGQVARILPPAGSAEHHNGGTVQLADLDGNGRAEVLFAATLARAGASLQPVDRPGCVPQDFSHSSGGSERGTVYIAWDDNFPASPSPWPAGFTFSIASPPGTRTVLHGELRNERFGEEILAGRDWDGDGSADLFVGDLVADGTGAQIRSQSGLGHVVFDAASLAGMETDMENPPPGLVFTRILGPRPGSITADTALEGDFDADGHPDLAISSPHDDPAGRESAGTLHVLYGRDGGWPALVDLAPGSQPPPAALRTAEIWGREGTSGQDEGDTLAYSGAPADLDADGHVDLVVNEMVGDGFGGTPLDVGNLIVVSGRAVDPAFLFGDGFESADTLAWTAAVQRAARQAAP
ncbi:MAG: hypothetical protein MI919_37085, partial [Holophagales bacterium]|nr:hypothetical protein [Holophagales bacterium]